MRRPQAGRIFLRYCKGILSFFRFNLSFWKLATFFLGPPSTRNLEFFFDLGLAQKLGSTFDSYAKLAELMTEYRNSPRSAPIARYTQLCVKKDKTRAAPLGVDVGWGLPVTFRCLYGLFGVVLEHLEHLECGLQPLSPGVVP